MVAAINSPGSNLDLLLGKTKIKAGDISAIEWVKVIRYVLTEFPTRIIHGMSRLQEIAKTHSSGQNRVLVKDIVIEEGMPEGFPKNMAFLCLGMVKPLPPAQTVGKRICEIPGKLSSSLLLLNRDGEVFTWEAVWNLDIRRSGPPWVIESSELIRLNDQNLEMIFSTLLAENKNFGISMLFQLSLLLDEYERSLQWNIKNIQDPQKILSRLGNLISYS